MRTTRITRRRVTGIVLLAVVVLTSAIVYRLLSTSTAPEPRAGDEQAAGFADTQLLDVLRVTADAADDRTSAVEDALSHPAGTLADPYPFAFELTRVDGSSITVAVYYHFDDTSFSGAFPGGSYWGSACRTYAVLPATVESIVTACAPTVPAEPH